MMEYHINEISRIQTIYKKNSNKAHTAEKILGRTEFFIVNKNFQKLVLGTKQHRKKDAFSSSQVGKNRLEETVKKEERDQNYGGIWNLGRLRMFRTSRT